MTSTGTSTGKIAAIIVAAGSGSRAGEGLPKQFRLIDGKPMLRHSVDALNAHPLIDAIVVVVAYGQEHQATEIVAGLSDVAIIIGGETRRDSVRNGLQHIKKDPEITGVFIHDAARPFLPSSTTLSPR